jgi:transcriptional regulator with XRE-family HTH domain
MKGLAAIMARHGDTMAKLAEFLDVNVNTVWRWRAGERFPALETQRAICGRYGCTADELLNGPAQNEFRVTLKYVKTLEGVNEEMNTNGISLLISDDGFVGVSGGKKLETKDDIPLVLDEIRFKLEEGFESRERMAAKRKEAEKQS